MKELIYVRKFKMMGFIIPSNVNSILFLGTMNWPANFTFEIMTTSRYVERWSDRLMGWYMSNVYVGCMDACIGSWRCVGRWIHPRNLLMVHEGAWNVLLWMFSMRLASTFFDLLIRVVDCSNLYTNRSRFLKKRIVMVISNW